MCERPVVKPSHKDARQEPPPGGSSRVTNRWLAPAAVVILAFAVRAAFVVVDGGYQPTHDAFDYDRHARAIAAGEGYPESGVLDGGPSALRAPAYPHVLGAVYAASGDSLTAGRLAGAALGALVALFVYLVAKAIWGRRVGLVAGVLAAIFPPLVLSSRELLSESLFLPLVLGAVLCVLSFRRSGMLRWAAAAGALCGLAALTRNPGLVLAIPIALGVWILRPRLRPRSLLAPGIVVACTLITIAPWTLRNAIEFGRFIPVTSSTGFALAGTYNQVSLRDDAHPASWRTPVVVPEYKGLFQTPGVDEGTLDVTLRREASEFAWDHPGYVVEAAGWNLLRLFDLVGGSVVGARGAEGGVVAAPGDVVEARGIGSETGPAERAGVALAGALALVGVFALARPRLGRGMRERGEARLPAGPWFLWLVPVVMILAAAPVSGVPRYRLPADPFLLILAAVGTVWIVDCLRAARARRGARLASSAAIIAAVAAIVLGGCGGGDDGEPAPATGDGAPSAGLSHEFVGSADAVCRDVGRDARRLGRRVDAIVQSGVQDPLALATRGYVEPGLRILERWSARMRRIEPPADLSAADRATLDLYLDLFYPIIELGHLRVRAGEAGDVPGARELEGFMRDLAEEQNAAARRLGLQDCAIDFGEELFPETAQGP